MFKHITAYPWTARSVTVWGYEAEHGEPQVCSCRNNNLPMVTQRANARLMSLAPQMFEIIRELTDNEEAMRLVRYMEADNAA